MVSKVTNERVRAMTIERVRHSGAYVISQFVGEGAGEYLFTRSYYGYTLREAKAQFRLALEEESK
jgi:hypothetical protein